MTSTTTEEARAAGFKRLRDPFPPEQIGQLPKPYRKDSPKGNCSVCHGFHGLPAMHLDYVGHAALTQRLLEVDPEWSWEPQAVDQYGMPMLDRNGGLWIKLTVLGVTRPGYGDAQGKQGGNAVKEAIGDALRNAGMRFGCALDLWSKENLSEFRDAQGREGDEQPPADQGYEQRPAQPERPTQEIIDALKDRIAKETDLDKLRGLWGEAKQFPPDVREQLQKAVSDRVNAVSKQGTA